MGLKGTLTLIKEGWHLFYQNLGVIWKHARFSFLMEIVSGFVIGLSIIGSIILFFIYYTPNIGLFSSGFTQKIPLDTLGILAGILLAIIFLIGFIGIYAYTLSYTISIIKSLGDRYQNKEVNTKEKYHLILPIFGISIMVGLIMLGGLILLIIPVIIFWVFFAFSIIVCVIDGQRGGKALSFSHSLSRGRFWKVFGRLLLINVLGFIVVLVVTYLPQFTGEMIAKLSDSTTTQFVGKLVTVILTLGSFIFQLLFGIFALAVSIVFYFNLKETMATPTISTPVPPASPTPAQ